MRRAGRFGRGKGRGGSRGRGAGRGSQRGRGNFVNTRPEYSRDTNPKSPVDGVEQSSESSDDVESGSADDDEELPPKHAAYNDLLAIYGQSIESESNRPTKKRKVNSDRQGQDSKKHVVLSDHNGNEKSNNQISDHADESSSDEADGMIVDESEEGGESGEDEEDEDDIADPFRSHFANVTEAELQQPLQSVKQGNWKTDKSPFGSVGDCLVVQPTNPFVPSSGKRKPTMDFKDLKLKERLIESGRGVFAKLHEQEHALASPLFQYQDVLFGGRTVPNSTRLRSLSTLHILNHIQKTRDRVLKNNARLAKQPEKDIECRDQGYTRPKILILLPTRNACFLYVEKILEISRPEQQEHEKRFNDSYTDDTTILPEKSTDDYRELFEGNSEDMFRIGLKFTRKTVQLFSPFYNSDIIIASPLGLRRAIESPKVAEGEKEKHDADFDFLSSIEILLLDQADALLMQNWDHIDYIFDNLNLQPREAHGCDFSRVRNWYLDGHAQHLRQTIVLSAFITPELLTLFSKRMLNVGGKIKYAPTYPGELAHLRVTGLETKQTFSRFECPSIATEGDKRFGYFTTAVIPSLVRFPKPPDGAHGILIFIPSYFDFVRVRNFFSKSAVTDSMSFDSVHENATPADATLRRARAHFHLGRHSVLLYTGRAHHFFRYRLKGVKKIILYALPDNPIFYREIVGGFLSETIDAGKVGSHEASVRALFCKYDALKLERIVGTQRVRAMLREKGGDTFEFV